MTTYTIYKDGIEQNTIVADEDFCKKYYSTDGYSYEKYSFPKPFAKNLISTEDSTKPATT